MTRFVIFNGNSFQNTYIKFRRPLSLDKDKTKLIIIKKSKWDKVYPCIVFDVAKI